MDADGNKAHESSKDQLNSIQSSSQTSKQKQATESSKQLSGYGEPVKNDSINSQNNKEGDGSRPGTILTDAKLSKDSKMANSLASSSRSRSKKQKQSSGKQPKIRIDENFNDEADENTLGGGGSKESHKKKSSRKHDKKGKRRTKDKSVSDDASSLLLDSSTLSKGKKGKGRRKNKRM